MTDANAGNQNPGQPGQPAVPPPPQAAPPPPSYAQQPQVPQAPVPTGIQLPQGVVTVSPWGRLGSYLLESVLIMVTLGIGWLIWAAMIGGTGQTPAKRLLNFRVIGADTLRPVGMGKMFFVRGLLAGMVAWFAITFTLGIILFMPFWDRRNQNLWDKVSNTYVVSDPHGVWNTKPTGI
jgi:uncharacterized RDD family membrane protein YckC